MRFFRQDTPIPRKHVVAPQIFGVLGSDGVELRSSGFWDPIDVFVLSYPQCAEGGNRAGS